MDGMKVMLVLAPLMLLSAVSAAPSAVLPDTQSDLTGLYDLDEGSAVAQPIDGKLNDE